MPLKLTIVYTESFGTVMQIQNHWNLKSDVRTPVQLRPVCIIFTIYIIIMFLRYTRGFWQPHTNTHTHIILYKIYTQTHSYLHTNIHKHTYIYTHTDTIRAHIYIDTIWYVLEHVIIVRAICFAIPSWRGGRERAYEFIMTACRTRTRQYVVRWNEPHKIWIPLWYCCCVEKKTLYEIRDFIRTGEHFYFVFVSFSVVLNINKIIVTQLKPTFLVLPRCGDDDVGFTNTCDDKIYERTQNVQYEYHTGVIIAFI